MARVVARPFGRRPRMLSKALSDEWAREVKVDAVAPGYVETEMTVKAEGGAAIDALTVLQVAKNELAGHTASRST
jgi:NAD(P)-dependent dehydrogenase (short-subunit alcohol dehydrogenase family)